MFPQTAAPHSASALILTQANTEPMTPQLAHGSSPKGAMLARPEADCWDGEESLPIQLMQKMTPSLSLGNGVRGGSLHMADVQDKGTAETIT